MVTNVTSLLKTVKAVEDEHTRGTRALESTIEVIGQEIRVRLTAEIIKNNVAHGCYKIIATFLNGRVYKNVRNNRKCFKSH